VIKVFVVVLSKKVVFHFYLLIVLLWTVVEVDVEVQASKARV
jgi:hypothetical protein